MVRNQPRLSKRFKVAVRFAEQPAYKVAAAAGVHPSVLSKLLNGLEPVRRDDPRVIAVGAVLGLLPERCFTRGVARPRVKAAR